MSWIPQPWDPIVLDVTSELLGLNPTTGGNDDLVAHVQSAKCSLEPTTGSPPNAQQRRSRHNANERRRTNAVKTRILLMRQEVDALERQRVRLKQETLSHNPPLLDTITLIDQLRQEQQRLYDKMRVCDIQNSTYQTIVSEYRANLSLSGVADVHDDTPVVASNEDRGLTDVPIFQRVLFRRPLSLEVVMARVKASYEAIMTFRAERDFESLDTEVLGWRDKRILNAKSLRFMLSQQFEYVPPSELVYKTWNLLTELKSYRHMQPRTVALELLQRVTEDCVIVRLSVSNGDKVHHSILLIARGRIDRGYSIMYRSIPLSEGQRQFAATESNYVHLFNWYMFLEKVTPAGIPACEVTFGGSVENQSMEYLRYLMMEVVACVVRWQTAVGHNKFRLTPS